MKRYERSEPPPVKNKGRRDRELMEDYQSEGTDRFTRHFKLPKSEIKKIRADYETKKIVQASIEKFREFRVEADRIFKFFEELTGKKTNREVMMANVCHYFEEGFFCEEMEDYIRAQLKADYFRNNPTMFTIANLFPIKDQDRMNIVWDQIAHYQSARENLNQKKEGLASILRPKIWNDYEAMFDPYALPFEDPSISDELKEIAYHFMVKKGQETILEYAERTYEKRVEISARYKIKVAKPDCVRALKDYIP
jgi:hypothetical protein